MQQTPEEETNSLIAYEIYPNSGMHLLAAPIARQWMDATQKRFAYRCLPLTIANQAGWMIASPRSFTAMWNGGERLSDTVFSFTDGAPDSRISCIFGHGVVTFNMPYLFRTPPGVNLWVKGPTNWPKHGLHALEGIVETDWTAATFTMNWKITAPNTLVRFERGEPCCMILPQPRGFIERFHPSLRELAGNAELAAEFAHWSRERTGYQERVAMGDPEAIRQGWQKDYFHGKDPGDSESFAEHQTKLRIREFEKEPGAGVQ